MKRIGLVAFLILTIGLTTAKNCRAELTTIDEMLAVHRQNIERLQSLHLQATVTTEWTEAYRNSCRREVQNGEKLIGLLESGEVTLDELNPQLAKIGYTLPMFVSAIEDSLESNRVLANNTQFLDLVEVFVNGRDYQVRSPICLSEIDKTDWRFPAADLSAKSLLSNYSETRIYSRSQSLEPKARVWCGAVSSTGSPETALKLEGHFNESTSLALPPYLQVIASRWDSRHPIAEFFKDPAQKYELVQREVVDNQTLVVVDALIPHDYPSSRQDDDGNPVKFQGYDLYRVWLDVSRGAVPVKLQWWAATEKSDHERVVATQPKGTLTTSKILELASGGFYPATTVLEKYGAVVSEDQKEVLGYEVHERKTWDCSLVESPVVLPEDFFVLEFPQGQAFYDWDNHEMVGAIDHKPAVLPGTPAPSLAGVTWLDGADRSLEEFRGKVVVLDFWGLWCSACRNSIPALKEVQDLYRDQPVVFVAVHTAEANQKEVAKRIDSFAGQQGWQFVQAIDSGTASHNSALANAFGVSGYPCEIVIDPEGHVSFNSDVPPPGMEDIVGKSCEEVTPEDEERMQSYMRGQFEAAGIEWPEDEELTQVEQTQRIQQLHVFKLKQQIDAALEKVRDR